MYGSMRYDLVLESRNVSRSVSRKASRLLGYRRVSVQSAEVSGKPSWHQLAKARVLAAKLPSTLKNAIIHIKDQAALLKVLMET